MVVEGCLNPLKIDNKNLKSVHFLGKNLPRLFMRDPKCFTMLKMSVSRGNIPLSPLKIHPWHVLFA